MTFRLFLVTSLSLVLGCSAVDPEGAERTAGAGVGGSPGLAAGVGGSGGTLTSGGTGGAGITGCNGTLVSYVRDFHASHPDMERFGSDHGAYGDDLGIVEPSLGEDRKPVYAKGRDNAFTTTTAENFWQWYNDVPGVNSGFEHPLQFMQEHPGSEKWVFSSNAFFPADGKGFAEISGYDDAGTPHNYHFTLELHTLFEYKQGQTFRFSGDDDVFVFINNQLVVDLGGVHVTREKEVRLDELGLVVGSIHPLDFFFAERHETQSNFTIETSLAFTECDIIIK